MATNTEIQITALKVEVAILKEQMAPVREETALIRDLAKQVVVLQSQLAEVTKTRDVWGQRGWMVLTACLSALLSIVAGTLGALLTYYLNAKR